MANFKQKTTKEIYNELDAKYTALRAKYNDTTPLLEKAVVKCLFYALAAVIAIVWQLITWVYKQCFPQTCDLEVLKFWGNLVGIDYKYGAPANLSIQLTGVSASSLSAGTTYKHLPTGLIYKTISRVNAESGVINATVECTTPGTVGNISIGQVLNIANPLDGIPDTATVTNVTINGSEDEEKLDYTNRVLSKFKSKSQGGSALDYYNWAMEVSGVVDALPYVLTEGLVDLYLVGEGSGINRDIDGTLSPNPFPSWVNGNFTDFTGTGTLLQVANSIEGSEPGKHDRRPIDGKVYLHNPTYTNYQVEITGLTTTAYNTDIKNTIISILDSKRPNVKVLGYGLDKARINRLSISAEVSEVIHGATFTDFILKNSSNVAINEDVLGVGCLANLSKLTINGTEIPL
jgi:hypothetical protein